MSTIRVENLGKRYVIGHQERGDTLRDAVSSGVRGIWHRLRHGRLSMEDFWALRDVAFEVEAGEVMGVVGRNGAGKSTLLKLLSRITEPTTGSIRLRGRVASLLEVGTGFHPELSGRENIFLNGAILGMRRQEIRAKLDEIVAFAEVERFLDTPVKRYSSGMYVRLAFAVAAHLEPEILIVDEVLAVGDAQFQKKCLGKMRESASTEGRTVLLVSHNLNQITALAHRCLVLSQGRVDFLGATGKAIAHYFDQGQSNRTEWVQQEHNLTTPHLHRVAIKTSEPGNVQSYGQELRLEFEFRHPVPVDQACFSFQIITATGQAVAHLWTFYEELKFADRAGDSVLHCTLPLVRLNVGRYSLRCFFSGPPGSLFSEVSEPKLTFEVVRLNESNLFGWRSESCAYFEEASWSKREEVSG